MPVVEVHNLTKRFGSFTAVDDISFDVAQGEVFGFLGPNGAGKTTLIKMLTGLHAPTSGSARVAGLDVVRDRDPIRHEIGYMSQLFSLYADLTVAENIDLFAGLYGVVGDAKSARTNWVLEMANLVGREDLITGTLPLGWKQRLALGCAVLHRPRIVFLDEPTSGVDPMARRAFWNLIDSMAAEGATVFVSTHYMEEAEYCNRLALMNRGRLIALDTPVNLKAQMDEPVMAFATDDPPVAVEAASHVPTVIEAAMFGRSVHVVVGDSGEAVRDIPTYLNRSGVTCEELHPIAPSLEDLFVALVRREGGAVAG
ncbi:MAG: ABC transporter ATP-binding protein [Gemmatimonadales bacterium]